LDFSYCKFYKVFLKLKVSQTLENLQLKVAFEAIITVKYYQLIIIIKLHTKSI